MSSAIKVDVWSDIACPWCYIGKRKFEKGAAEFAAGGEDRTVTVEFHSFELSPDTPVDFEGSGADYLAEHKGMEHAQVDRMLEHVTGVAQSVGLDYDFDTLQHTNTVKAHELLHYAKAHGKQLEVTERLMSAYFTEGRHIGRIEDLADLASEVGLDRGDVLRALEAGQYLEAVRTDERQAEELGVRGVPFFVIDRQYGVSGAQDADTFAQVLEQVWAKRSEEARV